MTSFHDFEQAGWERAAEFYGDAFGSLTPQTAPALLEAVGAARGRRLLDVASGPGFIAGAAAGLGSDVVGLDFAPAMITEARRRWPALTFREGDAESLPFDAGSFDAVVMNFGLLHLARPDAALADAHRVLRPGGRYAFTVWAAPERAVAFGLALRAIEEVGNPNVPLPEGPPFFRFSDRVQCTAAIAAAGFGTVTISQVPQVWRFPSPAAFFDGISASTVRTAALLRAQSPQNLGRIRAQVEREANNYANADGGIGIPMPALITFADKP